MSPAAHRDCSVQTVSMTGLTLIIGDDAAKANAAVSSHAITNINTTSATTCDCCKIVESKHTHREERCTQSATRRHFANYEPRLLQEVNDEIELGWDCGICLETAEDPCVTRCGHLYCQAHLNHWLSTHPSCPVCKALCTPDQDVVPIFSRGRTSPSSSPISSARSSPPPSDGPRFEFERSSPSPISERHSESPTPTITRRPWMDPMEADTVEQNHSPVPVSPQSTHVSQSSHPLMISHVLAHYLGIALRVLGIGILLGVLLR
ncbi:hypothetical protein K439DRAFT_1659296 [Ramaria rubella]|nr:hypothetical protein K439DRAFT_1659296 [Ramaria rubella]